MTTRVCSILVINVYDLHLGGFQFQSGLKI